MRLAITLLFAGALCAENLPEPVQPGQSSAFKWSVAALALSTAADIASTKMGESRGLYEANPLLATNGRLQAKGIAISVAVPVAVYAVERYILRRHPRADRAFTLVNFGVAGLRSGAAAHNWRLQ